MTVRVAAALTCHNRRETTLAALAALGEQSTEDIKVDLYLVDDGSTDGTGEAVQGACPDATVLRGDGSLYWARGMRKALEYADRGDYDYYLWLNDDTKLDQDAIQRLLSVSRQLGRRGEQRAVVVGSSRDPVTGDVTYGGLRRSSRIRRGHFELVCPSGEPQTVDAMHGNIVLVPRDVVNRIGHIDGVFRHSFGDEDYALRAWEAGCSVWLAPGTVGACRRNPPATLGQRPILQELRDIVSLTWPGLWPRDWAIMVRRWTGPLWPLYWASPYLRRGLRVVAAHARASTSATKAKP